MEWLKTNPPSVHETMMKIKMHTSIRRGSQVNYLLLSGKVGSTDLECGNTSLTVQIQTRSIIQEFLFISMSP